MDAAGATESSMQQCDHPTDSRFGKVIPQLDCSTIERAPNRVVFGAPLHQRRQHLLETSDDGFTTAHCGASQRSAATGGCAPDNS
jgi:hypothetical protein